MMISYRKNSAGTARRGPMFGNSRINLNHVKHTRNMEILTALALTTLIPCVKMDGTATEFRHVRNLDGSGSYFGIVEMLFYKSSRGCNFKWPCRQIIFFGCTGCLFWRAPFGQFPSRLWRQEVMMSDGVC